MAWVDDNGGLHVGDLATGRGLASAWTQVHIQFEEEVAAVLGINHAEVQQAALIAVAYPHRDDFKPAWCLPQACLPPPRPAPRSRNDPVALAP